jgi:outer membrane receptor protein involved in Fe transport
MRRVRARGSVAALALMVAASPVHAADGDDAVSDLDLDLKTLLDPPVDVWAATKTNQSKDEAPAVITAVTREQIAVWGYRSLAEVLSNLLGFYVVDDHVSPNLAVRGMSGGLYADSSIVKILIDGHPVAFQSSGGVGLGPELIPLSAVERIEIIRGPASALYGADAFLGVISIKTRRGAARKSATASVSGGVVGSKPATDVDASVGAQWRALDLLVAFRRTSQDLSGLELPATSPAPAVPEYNLGARTARGLDQVSWTALAKLTYRPGDDDELALFVYHSAMERGAEFGSLFQLANGTNASGIFSENRVSESQSRGGLSWDHALAERLRLSVSGSLFTGGPGQDNRLEVGSESYYVRRQFGFRGGEIDGQLNFTPLANQKRLSLVVGGSFSADDELLPSRIGVAKQPSGTLQPGDLLPAISVYQGRKTFLNSGAYLQGMWQVLDSSLIDLTGGIRYDRHNVYGGQLSSRFGIVSNPLTRLHLKALYGSAFKAPSPILLYAVPAAAADVIGNPLLKPQYVHTFELELRGEPAEWLELSSDVAYSLLTDKTEFIQQGINIVARNVARAATLSWESMAELKVRSLMRAHLSLELQQTVVRTGQAGYVARVVGSNGGIYPNAMVHAGVVVQPPRWPVRAAVRASYIGRRRASDTNVLLNGGRYVLPAYYLLDATVSTLGFHFFGNSGQETSFAVSGSNLLGSTGPTPGFSGVDYPVVPRALFLQINVTL